MELLIIRIENVYVSLEQKAWSDGRLQRNCCIVYYSYLVVTINGSSLFSVPVFGLSEPPYSFMFLFNYIVEALDLN